jgi:hypothetical protein
MILLYMHAATQTEVVNETLSFSVSVFSICVNFTINDDNIALQAPEEYNLTLLSPEDPQLQVERNSTRIIIIDDDGTQKPMHNTPLY